VPDLTDPQLPAALAAEPDAHARAALLGADLDALEGTRRRLTRAAWIAMIVPVVAIAAVWAAIADPPWEQLLFLLGGVVGAVFVEATALVLASALFGRFADSASLGRRAALGLAMTLIPLAFLGAATAAVRENPLALLFGIACGAIATAILVTSGAGQLPLLIRANHRKLVTAARQADQLPPWLTVRGGRIGVIVVEMVAWEAMTIGIVVLAWNHQFLAVPALVIAAVGSLGATYFAHRGNRQGYLVVTIAAAALVLATAIITAL